MHAAGLAIVIVYVAIPRLASPYNVAESQCVVEGWGQLSIFRWSYHKPIISHVQNVTGEQELQVF